MEKKFLTVCLIICLTIILLLSSFIFINKDNLFKNNNQEINNNNDDNEKNNTNSTTDEVKATSITLSYNSDVSCENHDKEPITITDVTKINNVEKLYNTAKLIENPQGFGGVCFSNITINYSNNEKKSFVIGGGNVIYIENKPYEVTYMLSNNIYNTSTDLYNYFK